MLSAAVICAPVGQNRTYVRLWRIPSAFGSRYQVSAVFLCCFLLLHSPMMLAWGKLALAASSAMHGGALQHVCYCTAQVLRRVTRPAALWVHATATSSCRSVLSCKAFQADVFLGAWLEAEALQLHDKGRLLQAAAYLGGRRQLCTFDGSCQGSVRDAWTAVCCIYFFSGGWPPAACDCANSMDCCWHRELKGHFTLQLLVALISGRCCIGGSLLLV